MANNGATVTRIGPETAEVTTEVTKPKRQRAVKAKADKPVVDKTTVAKPTRTRAKPKAEPVPARTPLAIWPMAAMATTLLVVSLPDQAAGLHTLTNCSDFQAWSLASAIDGLTMSTEFAAMTSGVETREFKYACRGLLGMSLTLSAALNSVSLGGSVEAWPNILIGCFIPAALALAVVAIGCLKR